MRMRCFGFVFISKDTIYFLIKQRTNDVIKWINAKKSTMSTFFAENVQCNNRICVPFTLIP